MKKVKRHGEEECLPFATIRDVLRENMDSRKGLLITPINKFFNQTENVVQRLKEVVRRTRRQLVTDVGDSLFGEEATRQMRELDQLDLQYLGLVLVLPRLIQLFILMFGMLTMSCAVWQGTISSTFEPRKIVNVFGKMCMFSFVYCILTQVAIFSILTDFGIPFYKVSVSWGLGFMYDVASEAIMWSIWIGMNNQFFFAIPKRKKTVTYSIPGVSDTGPNVENTWGTPM